MNIQQMVSLLFPDASIEYPEGGGMVCVHVNQQLEILIDLSRVSEIEVAINGEFRHFPMNSEGQIDFMILLARRSGNWALWSLPSEMLNENDLRVFLREIGIVTNTEQPSIVRAKRRDRWLSRRIDRL